MAGVIDLEDEDLLEADDNDLYNRVDGLFVEGIDDDLNVEGEEEANDENGEANANDQPATDTTSKTAPKKKVVRNPQPKLDAERLKGPRGLIILEDWFKDIKLKGKGHEKEDLDAIMFRMEQWTNRLFPKFTFDDCLKRIETLGRKREVSNYVQRIRMGMEHGYGGAAEVSDTSDIDDPPSPVREADPFDSLLGDAPRITSTQFSQPGPSTSAQFSQPGPSTSAQFSQPGPSTSFQVIQTETMTLTDEQRERMTRNRLLAEEKRLARAKLRAEEKALQERRDREVAEAIAASQAMFVDDDDDDL